MVNVIKFDSVNSTNDVAKGLIGSSLPLAVVTGEQTCGRGRYGRSFYSPGGCGVYVSYLFECGYALGDMQAITVAAAALTHQVLSAHSETGLQIKWVNDIMCSGRKLAGILTERVDATDKSGRYYIIIGVGVNVFPSVVPPELENIIGFLLTEKDGRSINIIIRELVHKFETAFADPSNFPQLIEYYCNHCNDLPADFAHKLLNK